MTDRRPQGPDAPEISDPLRSVHTSNLPPLFAELNIALVVSTYQAGKVIVVRNDTHRAGVRFLGALVFRVE